GLRQHVGRERPWIALRRDEQDFGGPGDEIDADFTRQQLFRGCHIYVTWTDDAKKRSEEHTSELQSRGHLVCRLLLEKKKTNYQQHVKPRCVSVSLKGQDVELILFTGMYRLDPGAPPQASTGVNNWVLKTKDCRSDFV